MSGGVRHPRAWRYCGPLQYEVHATPAMPQVIHVTLNCPAHSRTPSQQSTCEACGIQLRQIQKLSLARLRPPMRPVTSSTLPHGSELCYIPQTRPTMNPEVGLQASKFSDSLMCLKIGCHESAVLADAPSQLVRPATAALIAHLACSLASRSYQVPVAKHRVSGLLESTRSFLQQSSNITVMTMCSDAAHPSRHAIRKCLSATGN